MPKPLKLGPTISVLSHGNQTCIISNIECFSSDSYSKPVKEVYYQIGTVFKALDLSSLKFIVNGAL